MFVEPNGKKAAGFTLIEACLSLAIIGILGGLTTTAWPPLLESYHSRATQNAILQGFKDARTTAITQRQSVIICGSSTGKHCDRGWHSSFIIFLDLDGNHAFNGNDKRLQHFKLPSETSSLSAYRTRFRVREMGNLASHPDSIRYCAHATNGQYNWRAVINRIGRVRIDKQESNGKPIRCQARDD